MGLLEREAGYLFFLKSPGRLGRRRKNAD